MSFFLSRAQSTVSLPYMPEPAVVTAPPWQPQPLAGRKEKEKTQSIITTIHQNHTQLPQQQPATAKTKSQPSTHRWLSNPLHEERKKKKKTSKTTTIQQKQPATKKKNCNPNDLIDAFIDLTIVRHCQSHHRASNSNPQTTATMTHQ